LTGHLDEEVAMSVMQEQSRSGPVLSNVSWTSSTPWGCGT